MAASLLSRPGDSTGFVYSHERAVKNTTRYIVENGQPFDFCERQDELYKSLNPCYREIKKSYVLKEACEQFKSLRKELHLTFSSVGHKFALACDVWRNERGFDFVRVTAHWIDSDWLMQRRIIDFRKCGCLSCYDFECTAACMKESICKWGINDKVFAITTDDVTDNADILDNLKNVTHPILNGRVFNTRCVCRILNLCLQCAWKCVKPHIDQFYIGIAFVRRNFRNFCDKYGLERKLIIFYDDCYWDSTRDILRRFIPYKDAITEFIAANKPEIEISEQDLEFDSDEEENNVIKTNEISEQDWEIAIAFCRLLDVFHEVVDHISANYSPSSNVVLLHLVNIAKLFSEYRGSVIFKERFSVMEETFLKHFEKIPELFCLAAVMDPRIKLSGCESLLESFYHCMDNVKVNVEEENKEVFNLLHELYNLYASQCSNTHSSSSVPSGFAWSVINQKKEKENSENNEILCYLQTPFNFQGESKEFDILGWWKKHEVVFPVLASMARDILTVPASTLAPDCAFVFNEGKKILGNKMACGLNWELLEIITCLKDWFRAENRTQGERKLPDDEVIYDEEEEEEEEEIGDEVTQKMFRTMMFM